MQYDINLKAGEAKTIQFTVVDENGDAINIASATASFIAKKSKNDADSDAVISKVDGDFDKTQASAGIITVVFDTTDTAEVVNLIGELKLIFASDNVDISADKTIQIAQSVED